MALGLPVSSALTAPSEDKCWGPPRSHQDLFFIPVLCIRVLQALRDGHRGTNISALFPKLPESSILNPRFPFAFKGSQCPSVWAASCRGGFLEFALSSPSLLSFLSSCLIFLHPENTLVCPLQHELCQGEGQTARFVFCP